MCDLNLGARLANAQNSLFSPTRLQFVKEERELVNDALANHVYKRKRVIFVPTPQAIHKLKLFRSYPDWSALVQVFEMLLGKKFCLGIVATYRFPASFSDYFSVEAMPVDSHDVVLNEMTEASQRIPRQRSVLGQGRGHRQPAHLRYGRGLLQLQPVNMARAAVWTPCLSFPLWRQTLPLWTLV